LCHELTSEGFGGIYNPTDLNLSNNACLSDGLYCQAHLPENKSVTITTPKETAMIRENSPWGSNNLEFADMCQSARFEVVDFRRAGCSTHI